MSYLTSFLIKPSLSNTPIQRVSPRVYEPCKDCANCGYGCEGLNHWDMYPETNKPDCFELEK